MKTSSIPVTGALRKILQHTPDHTGPQDERWRNSPLIQHHPHRRMEAHQHTCTQMDIIRRGEHTSTRVYTQKTASIQTHRYTNTQTYTNANKYKNTHERECTEMFTQSSKNRKTPESHDRLVDRGSHNSQGCTASSVLQWAGAHANKTMRTEENALEGTPAVAGTEERPCKERSASTHTHIHTHTW